MKNRVSTYPGRVTLTPVSGAQNTYDMSLADVPIDEGTPLTKETLLQDSTAALIHLESDAVPDDVLRYLIQHVTSLESTASTTLPVSKGGTGQTSATKAFYALANSGSSLTGSSLATNDLIPFIDASATSGAKITLSDFLSYLMSNMISYGTTDLTAGSSTLQTGKIYLVYE